MEKNKRELIFNERGELCDKLIEYLERWVDKQFIPKHTNQGYRFDWQIIPGFEKYFGFDCNTKPLDLKSEEWALAKRQLQEWVNWVSINLFYPPRIIFGTIATDHVLLRIAVSKIDKIKLPKYYLDHIFDDLHFCYKCRRRAYHEYYYQVILGLPF